MREASRLEHLQSLDGFDPQTWIEWFPTMSNNVSLRIGKSGSLIIDAEATVNNFARFLAHCS